MQNDPEQRTLDFGGIAHGRGLVASRKQRTCVYCGATAGTRDHVPPRCLLEEPLPQNLVTVPSCRECNDAFSLDEQYLQVVIASVGHTPELMAKVDKGGIVDRALERAPALDQRILGDGNGNDRNALMFGTARRWMRPARCATQHRAVIPGWTIGDRTLWDG